MNAFSDPQFWAGLWKIIYIDILLAGDNAIVIALAVRSLPEKQQWWGRMFGAFGAVALRILFVWVISWLMKIPFLMLIGGVLLLWIAYKLVRGEDAPEGGGEEKVKAASSLWHAVWLIVVADVVMSFDNVVAISGASGGHFSLVIFGLLFSIPLVVFGSSILSSLMQRLPWLIWLGGGVLGYVATEMMLKDEKVHARLGEITHLLEVYLPWLSAVVLTGLGWFLARRQRPASSEAESAS